MQVGFIQQPIALIYLFYLIFYSFMLLLFSSSAPLRQDFKYRFIGQSEIRTQHQDFRYLAGPVLNPGSDRTVQESHI